METNTRLEALEHELKRMRLFCLLVAALFLPTMLIAATKKPTTIEASAFMLVDDAGKKRGEFASEAGGAAFKIFDGSGKAAVSISTSSDFPSIRLVGTPSEGRPFEIAFDVRGMRFLDDGREAVQLGRSGFRPAKKSDAEGWWLKLVSQGSGPELLSIAQIISANRTAEFMSMIPSGGVMSKIGVGISSSDTRSYQSMALSNTFNGHLFLGKQFVGSEFRRE